MKEIGDLLRQTREERGWSLKDVQTETKIRQKYIEALEKGDLSLIPGDVYAKGFLRSYANHLGLDGVALVEQLRTYLAEQKADEPPSNPAPARRSEWKRRGSIVALAAVATAAILGAAWWFAWRDQPSDAGATGEISHTDDGGNGTGDGGTTEDPGNGSGGGDEEPAGNGGGQNPLPSVLRVDETTGSIRYTVSATPIVVEVTVSERCWVEVHADGQLVFPGVTLEPGASTKWSANTSLTVRAGHPGGIALTVNGVRLGVVSDEGPKNLRFEAVATTGP